MMNYTIVKINIKNFKIFNKNTKFKILPLTILTGTNNSGKSSFLKTLLMLKESAKKHSLDRIEFSSKKLHLGSFDNCKTRNSKKNELLFHVIYQKYEFPYPNRIRLLSDKVLLGLSYEKKNSDGFLTNFNLFNIFSDKDPEFALGVTFQEHSIDILFNVRYILEVISSTIKKFDKKIPSNGSVDINVADQSVFGNFNKIRLPYDYKKPIVNDFMAFPKKFLNISNFILDLGKIEELFGDFNGSELSLIKEILNEYVLNFISYFTITEELVEGDEFKEMIKFKEITTSDVISYFFDFILNPLTAGFEYKIKDIDFNKNIQDYSRFYSDRNAVLFKSNEYKEIKNIIIERSADLLIADIIDNNFLDFYKNLCSYYWKEYKGIVKSTQGIEFIEVMKHSNNRLIVDENNSTPLEVVSNFLAHDSFSASQEAYLNKWIDKFGIGQQLVFNRIGGYVSQIIVIKDNKEVELADFGFGYIQLVTLLLSILHKINVYGKDTSFIYLIEEPETNLHPKLQSLLAELFVNIVNEFHISLIIETHSEYLIRKLQYLTAKKEIKPEDMKIYYFHDPNNIPKGEKQIKELTIREDGLMNGDFGPGFLDESVRLTMDLLKLQNRN